MRIDKYWSNFSPIDLKWHYLIGTMYAFISLSALATNIFVLYYLIK